MGLDEGEGVEVGGDGIVGGVLEVWEGVNALYISDLYDCFEVWKLKIGFSKGIKYQTTHKPRFSLGKPYLWFVGAKWWEGREVKVVSKEKKKKVDGGEEENKSMEDKWASLLAESSGITLDDLDTSSSSATPSKGGKKRGKKA